MVSDVYDVVDVAEGDDAVAQACGTASCGILVRIIPGWEEMFEDLYHPGADASPGTVESFKDEVWV